MANIQRNTVPTSMTSSRVTTPLLDASRVVTDSLVIDTQEAVGITHDNTANDPRLLPSSYSLHQAQSSLTTKMSSFTNKLDNIQVTPIISNELTPSYFAENSEWTIVSGWRYLSGQAYYRNDSTDVASVQGVLRLSKNVFFTPGNYFIRVEVSALTEGGKLYIKDYLGNEILPTILIPDTYAIEITIDHPDVYYLEVTVGDLPSAGAVAIDRIYIYKVEDRVQQYFNYLAESFVAGDGSGLASMAWTTSQITEAITSYSDNTTNTIRDLESTIVSHVSVRNPHGITPEMIDAANRVHTHDPSQCGAAPTYHTHTPEECGAAPVVHTHIPESIGAADRVHTHDPSECGAAPLSHAHTLNDISDIATVNNHIANTNNPHSVTKAQVGLGNVANYGVANQDDFTDSNSGKYVTTDGLGEYLDRLFTTDPTLRYTQLAPKKIVSTKLVLEADSEYKIPLNKNLVYDIYLDVHESLGANNLGFYFTDSMFINKGYSTNWNLGHTVNNETVVGCWYENADSIYLLPKDVGNNTLKGHIRLDTTLYSMTGDFQTQVCNITNNTVTPVTNTIFPLHLDATAKDFTLDYEPTTADIILVYRSDRNTQAFTSPITVSLVVFELVSTGNRNTGIDDAPILSVNEFLGEEPPFGWMIPDGRWLVKAYYPQLLAAIEKYGLAISEEEYNYQVSINGYCNYFVVNDGLIKLPTIPSTVGNKTTMIKTHLVPNKIVTEENTELDVVYVYKDDPSLFGQGPFEFIERYEEALGNSLEGLPGYEGD